MQKYLCMLLLCSIFFVSCSQKKGMTHSKIKIFSGALLSSQANNGLVLYGKNNAGKSFLKKISGDAITLDLPNGTWNFYAISWEYATPDATSGFKGTVSCGKSLGALLKGTDVNLNMNLTNANCDGAFHSESDFVSSERKLSSFSVNSCQNFSGVVDANSGTNCTVANSNKGFATYIKVVMPEYSNLGRAGDGIFGDAVQSKCLEIDSVSASSSVATADLTHMIALNLPESGLNGMALGVKTYYTETPCDDSSAPNIFFWKEGQVSSKLRKFADHSGGAGTQSVDHYFIQTDPADVCTGPRLSPTAFASGRGVSNLPYGICTPLQLEKIQQDFATTNSQHFDLLSNLDFGFASFNPIGEATNTIATPATHFTGSFNGNNFRIDNLMIKCGPIFSAAGSGVGLFRSTNNSSIKNLTLNKFAIDCKEEINPVDNIGMLVGTAINTKIQNIKAFGYVSGRDKVGGIVGAFTGSSIGELNSVHVEGNVEGRKYLGGLLGFGDSLSSTPNRVVITQSSFKGSVEGQLRGVLTVATSSDPGAGVLGEYKQMTAGVTLSSGASVISGDYIYYDPTSSNWKKLNGNNSQLPYDTYAGGIAGKLDSSSVAKVTEVKVDLDKLQGSRSLGGILGAGFTNITLQNSYVKGFIRSSTQLDGLVSGTGFSRIGGLAGVGGSGGTFTNNIIQVIKSINTTVADTFNHGVVGDDAGTSCTNNVYYGITESGTCQTSTNIHLTSSSILVPGNYDASYNFNIGPWSWPVSDQTNELPRLTWEMSKEAEVPYLRRLCSNLYVEGNRSGTGDSPNSPRSVCDWGQLMNMIPGKYYELKQSLFHDGTALTSYLAAGKLPAGVYHLDGNNFTLANFFVSAVGAYNALFETLGVGSYVQNLKILSASVASSGHSVSTGPYSSAILAANNYGLIRNIKVIDSKVNLIGLTMSGSAQGYVAGLVAQNNSSGVIEHIENDVSVIIDSPTVGAGVPLVGAGAVARNFGNISIFRQDGQVVRKIGDMFQSLVLPNLTCSPSEIGKYVASTGAYPGEYKCNGSSWVSATANMMNTAEEYAGLVAYNNGVIKEVDQQGELRIMDYVSNTNGKLSPFIITTNSGSVISDIDFRGRFYSNRANITSFFDSFAGSINRMITSFDSGLSGANFSAANSIVPASGASEMVCVMGGFADCPSSITYDYSLANGLTFNSSGSPIAGLQDLADWNIGVGFLPDLSKTWKYEIVSGANHSPELMRTGGNFEELGKGF